MLVKYIPYRLYFLLVGHKLKVFDLQAATNEADYIEISTKYKDKRYKRFMTIQEMIDEMKKDPCPFKM